jgi:hypothetical protein
MIRAVTVVRVCGLGASGTGRMMVAGRHQAAIGFTRRVGLTLGWCVPTVAR